MEEKVITQKSYIDVLEEMLDRTGIEQEKEALKAAIDALHQVANLQDDLKYFASFLLFNWVSLLKRSTHFFETKKGCCFQPFTFYKTKIVNNINPIITADIIIKEIIFTFFFIPLFTAIAIPIQNKIIETNIDKI